MIFLGSLSLCVCVYVFVCLCVSNVTFGLILLQIEASREFGSFSVFAQRRRNILQDDICM
jgi:hypothetical protein